MVNACRAGAGGRWRRYERQLHVDWPWGSVALEGGQNPHAALGRINALLLVLQALATAGPHAEDTSDHRKSADMLTCAQQLQLCLQVGGYKRNETQSTPVL